MRTLDAISPFYLELRNQEGNFDRYGWSAPRLDEIGKSIVHLGANY